ncbi:hypothetical protein Q0812_10415 [Brevundimonas sp. 2R-24]|uniref:Uncharacterized protein n=1 Tax=Peiella sedimenti TaxID=3061083 RepID=A0ABT8SMW6_9CAUL|nr:hypothetical protein [Caulobacteraceae bacterium XZ-24]
MSVTKAIFDFMFGPAPNVEKPRMPPEESSSRAEEDREFDPQVIDMVEQARDAVRRDFDQSKEAFEREHDIEGKKARLERARAFLAKAKADRILNDLLRETRYWPSHFGLGALDHLPRHGIDIRGVEPPTPEGHDGKRQSYTVSISGSRPYKIEVLDKGYSWSPVGDDNHKFGTLTISDDQKPLFAASISETPSDWSNWQVNLFGIDILSEVAWLPDIARFAETLVQVNQERNRARNAELIIAKAAKVIDPT